MTSIYFLGSMNDSTTKNSVIKTFSVDDDGDRGEEGMREGEGEKGERATGTSHLELF